MLAEKLLFPSQENTFVFETFALNKHEHEECVIVSYSGDSDTSNPIVRKANGIIFDKNTKKIICGCLSTPIEIDTNKLREIDLDNYIIQPLYEGTLLRRYFHNGQWKLATSRNTNAYKSYWSSKYSFGDLFEQNVDQSVLEKYSNTNNTYFFILHTVDNFLTNSTESNYCAYLGCVENNDPFVFHAYQLDLKYNYDNKESLLDDIISYSNDINNKFKGFLFIDKNGIENYKLENKLYSWKKSLTEGTTSSMHRYARNYYDINSIKLLMNLYPDDNYAQFEHDIIDLTHKLFNLYRAKFIYKKNNIKVDKSMKNCLYKLHSLYIKSKEPIVFQDAKQILLKNYNF